MLGCGEIAERWKRIQKEVWGRVGWGAHKYHTDSQTSWTTEPFVCVCVCVCVCVREREKKRGRERSQKFNKVRARREFNLPSPSIIRLPLPSQGIRYTKATQPSQKLNLASKTPSPGPQLPVGSAHLDFPG